MEKLLVVGIAEEHEDLKLIDMSIETFLTNYYGFLEINESKDHDNRCLTEDERFELEQLISGNIQLEIKDKIFRVTLKASFPISEYLKNIYVR